MGYLQFEETERGLGKKHVTRTGSEAGKISDFIFVLLTCSSAHVRGITETAQ